jgi:hypothetical protein
MFFKKWWKKIDKLITGVVIWWALASIFWISKKMKKKKSKIISWNIKETTWNILVKILKFFNKKK